MYVYFIILTIMILILNATCIFFKDLHDFFIMNIKLCLCIKLHIKPRSKWNSKEKNVPSKQKR